MLLEEGQKSAEKFATAEEDRHTGKEDLRSSLFMHQPQLISARVSFVPLQCPDCKGAGQKRGILTELKNNRSISRYRHLLTCYLVLIVSASMKFDPLHVHISTSARGLERKGPKSQL